MGVLTVSGSIIGGPSSGGAAFPTSTIQVNLGTSTVPIGFQACTGTIQRTLAMVAYTDLGEPGKSVTQAKFLYFRSSSQMLLRLTTDDGTGGNVVSIVPVLGLMILEFPTTLFLKQLEALGNGEVEYLLAGDK